MTDDISAKSLNCELVYIYIHITGSFVKTTSLLRGMGEMLYHQGKIS